MSKKGRVFSGARPTGRQHLGNYLGAIQNYVALQDEYECVYCIVDVHALTTVETTQELVTNTYEMALDWLAVGLDPEKSTFVVQSYVPEHADDAFREAVLFIRRTFGLPVGTVGPLVGQPVGV